MVFKTPIQKAIQKPTNSARSTVDEVGMFVFTSMITLIVTYHGLDSARKLWVMRAEAGEKIESYFRKKKEALEAEKAVSIK